LFRNRFDLIPEDMNDFFHPLPSADLWRAEHRVGARIDPGSFAAALAEKLHWQPRSDSYGDNGCGYGLASFDVQRHPTSPQPAAPAETAFG
jgi:hypothetical protein